MSRKSKRISKGVQHLTALLRTPDLNILGDSISALPVAQWKENMQFFGVPDKDLLELTGSFPATLQEDKITHPIFILQVNPSGHYVCPCSSRGNVREKRFIRSGCPLKMKNKLTEIDSFLVETCSFTMPLDSRFSQKLIFGGLVPESCIVDKRNSS